MEKKLGYYFNSHGFIRAYIYEKDGTATQIGSISSHCDDSTVAEWHLKMCNAIGTNVKEWFGGYYEKSL